MLRFRADNVWLVSGTPISTDFQQLRWQIHLLDSYNSIFEIFGRQPRPGWTEPTDAHSIANRYVPLPTGRDRSGWRYRSFMIANGHDSCNLCDVLVHLTPQLYSQPLNSESMI